MPESPRVQQDSLAARFEREWTVDPLGNSFEGHRLTDQACAGADCMRGAGTRGRAATVRTAPNM